MVLLVLLHPYLLQMQTDLLLISLDAARADGFGGLVYTCQSNWQCNPRFRQRVDIRLSVSGTSNAGIRRKTSGDGFSKGKFSVQGILTWTCV
jgi:hypothetical protein